MSLFFRSLSMRGLSGLVLGFALAARPVVGSAETPPTLPPTPTPVVINGPGTARLRIEALNNHLVRIWYKADGDFSRAPSLATAVAPTDRVPLKMAVEPKAVVVSTAALTVRVNRATLGFDVTAGSDHVPLLQDVRIHAAAAGGPWTLTRRIAPGERTMGLGQDNENTGRLDRRGTIRDLWAGQRIKSGNVTAQYPIPLLLSTGRSGHAYGVFYDDAHRLRFDLGKSVPDQVRCDATGGELDLYVIDGPTLADVVERYTSLTGRPSLPPLWALGYWQSKCTFRDWQEIGETYRQLTKRGFPVDVMVIDADWPQFRNDYVWAKRWYGPGYSPADKIAEYAKRGVRIVMSQSGPMIEPTSPTFASGWKAGVFATDGHGHPIQCGYYNGDLLDFTNPHLNSWLWPQARRLNEEGVAGWWLDLVEPEGEPSDTVYYGGDSANIHNVFSLLCARSYVGVQLAVHPDQRPFILARCGPAGFQRYHAAVWTGDIASDFATLRAHPPEMLNSGLSGLIWWTCDTGGFLTGYFRNDQYGAHARLYERWMEFSAFSPIVRAHKAGGAPQPYAFGTATEQACRHYLRLRYRLLPYIYSYAWKASRDGLPLVRPLALEFPDDPRSVEAPGNEYLFGRELLVAPVLHAGVTNRPVYFPPGQWFDWDTGCEYAGGRTWVVAAPPNRIPVAIRAGAIIPLAPFMRNTSQKPWDPITLEIYPAGRSSFTMYHDDGITFAYRHGDYTTTTFTSDASSGIERFMIAESNKRYVPHRYVLHFHLQQTPTAVTVDGAAADRVAAGAKPAPGQWRWNPVRRVLAVELADGTAMQHGVAVTLDGVDLPARLAPMLKADKIEPDADARIVRPRPHLAKAPVLPARVEAVDYDDGGEGVAFHCRRPLPVPTVYRKDDIGCVACTDEGGGYALTGRSTNEWVAYTVDAGDGGYFDLTARVLGSGRFRLVVDGQTIATIDSPEAGAGWRDIALPNVYLNPGDSQLMLVVDRPGFVLSHLDFRRAAAVPTTYDAALARHGGTTEIRHLDSGFAGHGTLYGLGHQGTSLTFGLDSPRGGHAAVRIYYNNGQGRPVVLSCALDGGVAKDIELPPTEGDAWHPFVLPVTLSPGTHRLVLDGREKDWGSVQVDHLQVVLR